MPVYNLPDFNLLGDVWIGLNTPGSGNPPNFVAIPCQIYKNSRGDTADAGNVTIRTPSSTTLTLLPNDIWEIPQGSGRYFFASNGLRIHEGFPNEYWAQIAHRCTAFGIFLTPGLP